MTPGLRNTLVIARREFVERARSRWFLAITLLGPIGIVALTILPALLIGNPAGSRVEIVDRSGVLAEPLAAALTVAQWKPAVIAADTPDAVEMARIRDRKINGFITIPADALDGGKILYRGDNGSNQIAGATLREIVRLAVQAERGKRAGIGSDKLAELIKPAVFEPQQTNGKAEAAAGEASFAIGYVLAYVLLLVIMTYAVAVMRSVVQEKTSRVMELMVATVKPRSLMAGKIVGVGGAGLVQVAVWLGIGALALTYHNQLLGAFGISGGSASVTLPSLTFDVIALALGYFVLGFFFYAAMYAAVGAMVSTEQDTQQVQLPVMLLLLVGLASVTSVSGDPRGVTATVMTMVPFWSPLLMPMRYVLGGATPVDLVISLAILLVSTVLISRAAAKIYRIGVLMYGKRPTLQELVRWLRY